MHVDHMPSTVTDLMLFFIQSSQFPRRTSLKRTQRLKEVIDLAENHTANQEWSEDLSPWVLL